MCISRLKLSFSRLYSADAKRVDPVTIVTRADSKAAAGSNASIRGEKQPVLLGRRVFAFNRIAAIEIDYSVDGSLDGKDVAQRALARWKGMRLQRPP
jgi:hypothetical protein